MARVPQNSAECINGFADIYPCHNIDLLAFLPLSSIGGGASTNDIWGWTDPDTQKEYALIGTTAGTGFIDVSDPLNPLYLGILPRHASGTFWDAWRDVKVFDNHAYIVSENRGQGMQIFDLTQLRAGVSPSGTFSNTAHYAGIGGSHNIFINEDSGYGYIVGAVTGTTCSGGLHMIDLTNPTDPSFAGCFSADGYTHDVQCVNYTGPDTVYIRQEICFASNTDTLTIVDVSDKSAPVQLSRTTYSGRGYTHQGWLTEDQAYHLMNDELDERASGHNTKTYIWDVRDLDAPQLIATHLGTTAAIDHNLYIKDNLNYQANYEAGLRILNIDNVENGLLEEIAHFDTYPSRDANQYNGAWSVYPFFESGTLIVSGIDEGLFILRHHLAPDISLGQASSDLLICDGGSITQTLQINPLSASSTITLTVNGAPSHLTSTLNPSQFNSSTPVTSTLSLSATNNTVGTYPLTIHATDSSITGTLELAVTTQTQPNVTQTYPLTSSAQISPTFHWDVTAFSQYTLEVATDSSFNNLVLSETVATGSYTPTVALAIDTTYYWRVTGSNACGTVVSSTASFIRQDPFPFKYLFPIVLK